MAIVEPGLYPEDQTGHETGACDHAYEEYGSHLALPAASAASMGERYSKLNIQSSMLYLKSSMLPATRQTSDYRPAKNYERVLGMAKQRNRLVTDNVIWVSFRWGLSKPYTGRWRRRGSRRKLGILR